MFCSSLRLGRIWKILLQFFHYLRKKERNMKHTLYSYFVFLQPQKSNIFIYKQTDSLECQDHLPEVVS